MLIQFSEQNQNLINSNEEFKINLENVINEKIQLTEFIKNLKSNFEFRLDEI